MKKKTRVVEFWVLVSQSFFLFGLVLLFFSHSSSLSRRFFLAGLQHRWGPINLHSEGGRHRGRCRGMPSSAWRKRTKGESVAVQHDKDSYSKTVNTENSSTKNSAAPCASTAPNAEIVSESHSGTSSTSPATVTWSRQDTEILVCHLCNYSTEILSRQVDHSRTHTGERALNFDLCP